MAVQPVPEGFHTITPYLIVEGATKLIEFIKAAFDAQEMHLMKLPDGSVMHGTYQVGDSMVMVSDARDDFKALPCMLYLYVPDVDATYQQAIKAGATSLHEPQDEFYGDRSAGVVDPCGIQWWMATHVEDVPPDEMEKRREAMMSGK